jgi:hypothetical protein
MFVPSAAWANYGLMHSATASKREIFGYGRIYSAHAAHLTRRESVLQVSRFIVFLN